MANHQLNITENGTKTLKTAGKYCDRDIDVNVNVTNESTDITSTGTIVITANGTYDITNYASANVNVPTVQATQITNILDLDTTIVKSGYRCTSTGYNVTVDGVAIVCFATAGTHRIRVRGKYVWGYLQTNNATPVSPYYINFYKATSTPSDSTFAGTILNDTSTAKSSWISQDEYGDWYFDFTMSEDGYVGFTLKDMSLIYDNATYDCEPIITIDEAIGNS